MPGLEKLVIAVLLYSQHIEWSFAKIFGSCVSGTSATVAPCALSNSEFALCFPVDTTLRLGFLLAQKNPFFSLQVAHKFSRSS